MTMNDEEGPATVAEALDSAPEPTPPMPHGVPSAPVVHMGAPTAAELYEQAREQKERERAAAQARQAAEAEWERKRQEYAQIAAEAQPALDEIVQEVRALLPGCDTWAARVEEIKADAAARGAAVDAEQGPAEVRDHLHSHAAEALMPFFDLLRMSPRQGPR